MSKAKEDIIEKIEKIVPDTSAIIDGLVSRHIADGKIKPQLVIIHEAVLAELEHQANLNKAIGFLGLEELDKLKDISKENGFELEFGGKRPSAVEIKYARLGEIDSMIRNLAYDEDAILFTADKVQARIAKAKGMKSMLIEVEHVKKALKLDKFFDETTMSAHLRENVEPFAKKGRPGAWEFVKIRDKMLTRDEIQDISREIIEEADIRKDAFIEIERPGSTIVQLGLYRIVITKPPFSDGWEITAVRPVKRLKLEDYKLSDKLQKRISEQAEGILIAGAPGHGKSTFAQALAEFYAAKGKVVKTIEAPRDLVLPESVTQYAISHGDPQEIHDILLLSRPDYTLFDEMRNTNDFKLFADLRLAGIGLAGVVHATNPIDAIQRFVGRIELGVIPHIIDTVIFIKDGAVYKVLSLNMVIKVPSGMTEADLARPVVVVNDFETKKLEYELYSYGEETVVVPVKGYSKAPSHALAERAIEDEFRRYSRDAKVDVVSDNKCIVYVPEQDIARIIGKQGKNIEEIEKKLGMSIDVQELSSRQEGAETRQEIECNTRINKKNIQFILNEKYNYKEVDIHIGDEYLLTVKVGKTGIVNIQKNNKIGKMIIDAINIGEKIRLFLSS